MFSVSGEWPQAFNEEQRQRFNFATVEMVTTVRNWVLDSVDYGLRPSGSSSSSSSSSDSSSDSDNDGSSSKSCRSSSKSKQGTKKTTSSKLGKSKMSKEEQKATVARMRQTTNARFKEHVEKEKPFVPRSRHMLTLMATHPALHAHGHLLLSENDTPDLGAVDSRSEAEMLIREYCEMKGRNAPSFSKVRRVPPSSSSSASSSSTTTTSTVNTSSSPSLSSSSSTTTTSTASGAAATPGPTENVGHGPGWVNPANLPLNAAEKNQRKLCGRCQTSNCTMVVLFLAKETIHVGSNKSTVKWHLIKFKEHSCTAPLEAAGRTPTLCYTSSQLARGLSQLHGSDLTRADVTAYIQTLSRMSRPSNSMSTRIIKEVKAIHEGQVTTNVLSIDNYAKRINEDGDSCVVYKMFGVELKQIFLAQAKKILKRENKHKPPELQEVFDANQVNLDFINEEHCYLDGWSLVMKSSINRRRATSVEYINSDASHLSKDANGTSSSSVQLGANHHLQWLAHSESARAESTKTWKQLYGALGQADPSFFTDSGGLNVDLHGHPMLEGNGAGGTPF